MRSMQMKFIGKLIAIATSVARTYWEVLFIAGETSSKN